MKSKNNLYSKKSRRNASVLKHQAEVELKGIDGLIDIKCYSRSVHVHMEPDADISAVPALIANRPVKVFVNNKIVKREPVKPQVDKEIFGKSQASLCLEEGKSLSGKSFRQRIGLTVAGLILLIALISAIYFWPELHDYILSKIQSLRF